VSVIKPSDNASEILVCQVELLRANLADAHVELDEIKERAAQLRKLFPLCIDATVPELITQAANELRRLRGMTVRAPRQRVVGYGPSVLEAEKLFGPSGSELPIGEDLGENESRKG